MYLIVKLKEIRELLNHPSDYDKLSDDILYALDLGRKAPSAANTQMWRFAFEDNFKTIQLPCQWDTNIQMGASKRRYCYCASRMARAD